MSASPWADPDGGYAILGLLALAIVGAALAPAGIRDRSRAPQRIIATALLAGLALSLLWPRLSQRLTVARARQYDASGVIGLWTYANDSLVFAGDGAYRCRGDACSGFSHCGTWHLTGDSHLVARWSDGHEVTWTIVRYHGRDRLGLSAVAGTGATWSAGLTFMHVSP